MVEITGLVTSAVESIRNHFAYLNSTESIIFYIALILIISTAFAFIARYLKQPLILAYVVTGAIIGPLVLGLIRDINLINVFSEIGIAFLLFTAGLEISFRKIKEANLSKIIFIGIFQIAIIFFLTFFARNLLGLTILQSFYIGMILAFSSTMVDVKILSDRGELVTLHGRLILGILLLQYIIAMIAIVFFTNESFSTETLSIALLKLLGLIAAGFLMQKYVLNQSFKFAAKSGELLFLYSLAILFLFVTASYLLGFSIVIGAFIAGVSIANSPFKTELESRILPLRDFFAILFFVALGMQLIFEGIGSRLLLLGFLIVGALIIKPIVTFILLKITRYQTKTSFLTSISLAQLSEFSLKIAMIGFLLGILDTPIMSTVILATIITMAITPYLIDFKGYMFRFIRYPLGIFNLSSRGEKRDYVAHKKKETLLIGAHRMGSVILKKLEKDRKKLLVIDYNPEIISALSKKNISCIYGDISSPEIISLAYSNNLKTVISTIPSFDDNLFLLRKVKEKNPNVKVIVTGGRISDAERLYAAGADYVITPKIIAGNELAHFLGAGGKRLEKAKEEHLKYLKDIHRVLY